MRTEAEILSELQALPPDAQRAIQKKIADTLPKRPPGKQRRGKTRCKATHTTWLPSERRYITAALGGTWSPAGALRMALGAPDAPPTHLPTFDGPKRKTTSVGVNEEERAQLEGLALDGEKVGATIRRLALWAAAVKLGPDWVPTIQRSPEAIHWAKQAADGFGHCVYTAVEQLMDAQARGDREAVQEMTAGARAAVSKLSALVEAVVRGDLDPGKG